MAIKIKVLGITVASWGPHYNPDPPQSQANMPKWKELAVKKEKEYRGSKEAKNFVDDNISPLCLGPEYDDLPFASPAQIARGEGSWRVVDGVFCSTIGEYRREMEKSRLRNSY